MYPPLSGMAGQVWEGVKTGRAPSPFSVLATWEVLNLEKNVMKSDSNRNQVVNSSLTAANHFSPSCF